MNPELVSEETIQGLALDEINKLDLKSRDKTDAMWAAIHTAEAALKELGIVLVIDLDKETMKLCERDDICHADIIKKKLSYEDCPFEEGGALLVRAKEKP